jgi:hypothetical protein
MAAGAVLAAVQASPTESRMPNHTPAWVGGLPMLQTPAAAHAPQRVRAGRDATQQVDVVHFVTDITGKMLGHLAH